MSFSVDTFLSVHRPYLENLCLQKLKGTHINDEAMNTMIKAAVLTGPAVLGRKSNYLDQAWI